ncbi:MAG: hypothetical protein CFE31_07620 [Rhizobiales bacterium PAR1]|nr:MAG: hypothetical protein CFE31_07620 [Rhizobiales bacterium PAR1]
MTRKLSELVEEQAFTWSGVKPPNMPGVRLAEALESSISGFEALRGLLAFEDEPSSFEAALQATKEVC